MRSSSPYSHREMYSPELNSKRTLINVQLLHRELVMEKGFLDKVKDNVVVRVWSEKTQQEKGDSLMKGYMSELWDLTNINYWNPANSYFTFGKVDLLPTIEEYTTLLRCPRIQADKAYCKDTNVPTFLKRLMSITGITPGHIDDVILDLFDRLDKKRVGEERFIRCAQLLLAWFHSHFWKVEKVSYLVFSESYSPLKEFMATPRRDTISEEKWMAILQSLQDEDVTWTAPWMIPDEILYRCGDFDWVPLLGI
ncbi:hypothetical protein Golob_004062 [Gossypium lobatum]|uniref:DUF7745 domain-containing protein n=2 Tax=Gossypium lobatum TaxID=34289 RepID=A0A7J8N0G5_9ROSI|nr:hypothetical protein [Gossypium lobatum]